MQIPLQSQRVLPRIAALQTRIQNRPGGCHRLRHCAVHGLGQADLGRLDGCVGQPRYDRAVHSEGPEPNRRCVVGSIAGFILLAFFIQDRWLFFLFFSLWVAVCTYFSFGSERYNYFWQQAGFFAVVVGLDSAFSPANAFAIAIERTQGAGTGLLVYMLVGLLLWPANSRSSLEKTSQQLTASMKALFANSMARLLGIGRTPAQSRVPSWRNCSSVSTTCWTRPNSTAGRSMRCDPPGGAAGRRSPI
jgi:hypothetical protein